MNLLSPTTGRPLFPDTPHSLTDGRFERWPVLEGIPYLRTRSEGLVARALFELDRGHPDAALIALLSDQDEWWQGPPTDLDELALLVARRDELSLREAMRLLRLGPVADYFAYRWSDPTYLAGLALLEAHWCDPATAFELASGIGHYARELGRRGVRCLCADVVFAKCWLAKNWVAPDADYVVFDAGDDWPIGSATFDLVQCHDAFYFLPAQQQVAKRLRGATRSGGVLAVTHLHNAGFARELTGPARTVEEWRRLFCDATVYDESELRDALLHAREPRPAGWAGDERIEAWSLVEGGAAPRPLIGGLAMPPADAALARNPLLTDDGPAWPSSRYREEYGAACAWADRERWGSIDPARSRCLVDLPERW